MTSGTQKTTSSQSEKFKLGGRELETDEEEAAWEERLKKVPAQEPKPERTE